MNAENMGLLKGYTKSFEHLTSAQTTLKNLILMCQDDDTVTGITPADVARQNELHDLLDSEWDALQQYIAHVNSSVGEVKKLLMESDGFAARVNAKRRKSSLRSANGEVFYRLR